MTPDRTLPLWLRAILIVSGGSSLFFGLTLLATPDSIASLWPWTMTPVTARLLGASTLVSVPLALFSAIINRWRLARIPFVMLLAYRVLQILAGLWHLDRFDFAQPATWNYFGGGGAFGLVLALALWKGQSWGEPTSDLPPGLPPDAPLRIGRLGKRALHLAGLFFFSVGCIFFAAGQRAESMWFEAPGQLKPLTGRLFASPMVGLGLAYLLIRRSTRWHDVAIPALGMMTFGVAGNIALALESTGVQPPGLMGWVLAAAPSILLATGLYLWMPARRMPG